jgi:hypothetical protein
VRPQPWNPWAAITPTPCSAPRQYYFICPLPSLHQCAWLSSYILRLSDGTSAVENIICSPVAGACVPGTPSLQSSFLCRCISGTPLAFLSPASHQPSGLDPDHRPHPMCVSKWLCHSRLHLWLPTATTTTCSIYLFSNRRILPKSEFNFFIDTLFLVIGYVPYMLHRAHHLSSHSL